MATTYFFLKTTVGDAAIAAARAAFTPLDLAEIAVGDGGGSPITPAVGDVALTNEVWRGDVRLVSIDTSDPSNVSVMAVIPRGTGGFTIREAGIFDSGGTLIAIASVQPIYKPTSVEGGDSALYVYGVIEVTDAADAITQLDANAVIASHLYVDGQIGVLLHPDYS